MSELREIMLDAATPDRDWLADHHALLHEGRRRVRRRRLAIATAAAAATVLAAALAVAVASR
ncbi:hypothetical protein DDE18_17050 [Nocardioides gansuensis]|jgi:hypothetical protein|uniref:Uncharacterized protein n=1 Tax=Nocardioides gansuensis TaxID=2138300 RepID=A0A2T8F7J8_9ACTN|nr:hypothetical protein [Nocardioides gansuensis]PVG81692.1 hypothetical protein DDE18_17050 [Nocardioides gansuensis]